MQKQVCIICPEHGEFWQSSKAHLKYKNSCPLCHQTDSFLKKAKKIHGDKYDYSKVKYVKNTQKVCIICPEHGEFWQSPNAHISHKNECPKCAAAQRGLLKRIGLDKFIKQSNKIHNNKYDYSKFVYTGSSVKSIIICPEHGEFLQSPDVHRDSGCPKCGIITGHNKQRIPLNEYIKRCNEVHNNKYDYSKVTEEDYIKGKICIICPEHGEFWKNRKKHLVCKQGCPHCKQPIMEKLVEDKLIELNIKYEKQKKFDWLKYRQKLRLDFYLPEYNVAIECQGIQHFVPICYSKNKLYNYVDSFQTSQFRDDIKHDLCAEHNIQIYYFSTLNKQYKYPLYNNIEDIIKELNN